MFANYLWNFEIKVGPFFINQKQTADDVSLSDTNTVYMFCFSVITVCTRLQKTDCTLCYMIVFWGKKRRLPYESEYIFKQNQQGDLIYLASFILPRLATPQCKRSYKNTPSPAYLTMVSTCIHVLQDRGCSKNRRPMF